MVQMVSWVKVDEIKDREIVVLFKQDFLKFKKGDVVKIKQEIPGFFLDDPHKFSYTNEHGEKEIFAATFEEVKKNFAIKVIDKKTNDAKFVEYKMELNDEDKKFLYEKKFKELQKEAMCHDLREIFCATKEIEKLSDMVGELFFKESESHIKERFQITKIRKCLRSIKLRSIFAGNHLNLYQRLDNNLSDMNKEWEEYLKFEGAVIGVERIKDIVAQLLDIMKEVNNLRRWDDFESRMEMSKIMSEIDKNLMFEHFYNIIKITLMIESELQPQRDCAFLAGFVTDYVENNE